MPIPIVDQLLSPPLVYFVVPIIAVVIAYILYKQYYGKEDVFEIEQFKDVVIEDIQDKFKGEGLRSKGFLMRGIDYFGKIDAWLHLKGTHEIMKYDPAKQLYVKSEEKGVPYDLYLLRMPPLTLIDKIFREPKKYFLIDKKHFHKFDPVSKSYNLKEDVQLYIFGGVFISSISGEEWITDISIKRANENTLTYLMNYSKKIIYLELAHAKTINRASVRTGLKKEQWESMKKEAEDVDENED